MIELKKSENIVDTIRMGQKELKIEINVTKIAGFFNDVYTEMLKAEEGLRKSKDKEAINSEAIEKYGQSVITLMELLFGYETTKEIIAFYEHDYIEMIIEIFPVINSFIPKLKEAASLKRARIEAIKELYLE